MRIQVQGRSSAGWFRSVVALVAIAAALGVAGPAWASPMAERTYAEPGREDAPAVVSERTYSDAPATPAADAADTGAPATPAVAVSPPAPSDDGLGALAIVAIALGGVLGLVGVAYTARRVVHHGQPAH